MSKGMSEAVSLLEAKSSSSKTSTLVFESPVRSGLLGPRVMDRDWAGPSMSQDHKRLDQDRKKPQKTGLDQSRPVLHVTGIKKG